MNKTSPRRSSVAGPPPQCVGLIMDGNRRWAKARGLPSMEGHRRGSETMEKFLSWAKDLGIKHVVLYAFSIENWKRKKEEVLFLMDLFREVLGKRTRGVRVRCIGVREMLPPDIQKRIQSLEKETKYNKGLNLYLALSYGGRDEILQTVNRLLKRPTRSLLTTKSFARLLPSYPMPDPDLIIRTSGEMRLSNFLTWQSAYSELFFTPTYWPDFSKKEFAGILKAYAKRQRRYGV